MNTETSEHYQQMFEALFTAIENASQHPIHFGHIHGRGLGIQAITVDMDGKQARGMLRICRVYATTNSFRSRGISTFN